MRTRHAPRSRRRVLCVSPRYAPSFGTFHHSYPLFGGRIRAFMPPQGLLVIAAYLPESWEVRFVDENARAASEEEFRWADAVFLSGMHVQRLFIEDVITRAHRVGKPVVLGGPSVSGCPEHYTDADLIQVGEMGDSTDAIIAWLDEHEGRPARQLRFDTVTRLPLTDFPLPAYHLIALRQYFIASIQFSSGCPFTCEFCDIPALYGRNPRLKTAAQVVAELDALVAGGAVAIYFVDDNFIANQKAALELLPHLVEWQRRHRFPVRFACEATLNVAKNERVLALMRDAGFNVVFCGIETPEPEALRSMSKDQNLRMPILDAVRRLNDHGLEVVSGIILGLDTDTEATADHLIEFIEASRIPMLTINILYALPKTPLWDRLAAEGRIHPDGDRESNVVFRLPEPTVLAMWRRCIAAAYAPEAIYRRFAHQLAHTFAKRPAYPRSPHRASGRNVLSGLALLARIVWRIGVRGDYRRTFWRVAGPALRAGRVEEMIQAAVVSHHLIEFTRQCLRGAREASFYAPSRPRPSAAALRPIRLQREEVSR
ncbi:MAG TPA: B12-binding domain-containing radical SAM protein [Methylomirabilota bacterium]|nr:B12-binding domain-containing radical SAM protein [Methylomirabilota bacterium]